MSLSCIMCHGFHGLGLDDALKMVDITLPYFTLGIVILQVYVAYLGYKILKVVKFTPLWTPAWIIFVGEMLLLIIRRFIVFFVISEKEHPILDQLFDILQLYIFPSVLTLGWLFFTKRIHKLFSTYLSLGKKEK